MNMEFFRKLPIPMDIKKEYPLSKSGAEIKKVRDEEIAKILKGEDRRLILITGPCSADMEDSVTEYMERLSKIAEKVKDKVFIIPRLFTGKPRSRGDGYLGMIHQPDPMGEPDMQSGIVLARKLNIEIIEKTGLSCADEMLYPENYRYLSDLLSYVSVGARSSEDQHHRMCASGLDIPVGMKNPTNGNIDSALNAVKAAQIGHDFLYRGWEVRTKGNPLAHAVLRGYTDKDGVNHENYSYENLSEFCRRYYEFGLENPALIIDTNHANSDKEYEKQPMIAMDVLNSMRKNKEIAKCVKGLMIESYLIDGAQNIGEGVYGKSITDPCLGWDKTERLIYEIADKVL